MTICYAGIGSRETPEEVKAQMGWLSAELAKHGMILHTGAAIGADQAFANGAYMAGGHVRLFLPWPSYEKDWIASLQNMHTAGHLSIYAEPTPEGIASVAQFHPAAQNLKQGPLKLHARNYDILRGVRFVLAWTKDGKATGGTGQAIRIATHHNITVFNLFEFRTQLDIQRLLAHIVQHAR